MTIDTTKYRSFSTTELLQEIEDLRGFSPVIDSLIQRIEDLHLTCPVCECDLEKARKELQ